jgi:hypothetical protein
LSSGTPDAAKFFKLGVTSLLLLLELPSKLLISAAFCPPKSSAFTSFPLSFILLSFFGVI